MRPAMSPLLLSLPHNVKFFSKITAKKKVEKWGVCRNLFLKNGRPGAPSIRNFEFYLHYRIEY